MATVMAFGVVAGVAAAVRERPGVVEVRRVDRLDPRRHPELLDARRCPTSTGSSTRRSRPIASTRTRRATRRRTATTAARPRRRTRRSPATPSTAATVTSSPTTSRVSCPSCATTSASSRWASCSPTSSATRCRHASATSRRPPSTWSSRPTASPARGRSTSPTATTRTCTSRTDDLDNALAGLLTLSDPSGIDGGQDGAHGNGFDRVSAFQDGYEGGAQACADYQNNPPAVTETGLHELRGPGDRRQPAARRDGADDHQEPGRVLDLAVVEAHRADRDRGDGRRRTGDGTRRWRAHRLRHLRRRRTTPCTTTRRRCRTCTTTSATSAAACSWRPRGRRRSSTSWARRSAPTTPAAAPSAWPERGRRTRRRRSRPATSTKRSPCWSPAGKGYDRSRDRLRPGGGVP